ncbi:hypothetical protein [Flavobacterium sp.]|uniref:hypothetical protein n=1 Tax=Flavobacterium sp. TaxID=239 RepID=UPI00374D372D
MKKIFLTLITVITICSCSTYLDGGKNINTDYMDFNYMQNYNEFIYKSKVNSTADKEVYYPTHFKIDLPKKIKNWQSSNNEFYFEYSDKEIIYINSGFKNTGTVGSWILKETDDNEIFSKLSSYWNKRKYDEDDLKLEISNRKSQIYSDGKTTILLYNIKRENFERYLTLVKSFKYLD